MPERYVRPGGSVKVGNFHQLVGRTFAPGHVRPETGSSFRISGRRSGRPKPMCRASSSASTCPSWRGVPTSSRFCAASRIRWRLTNLGTEYVNTGSRPLPSLQYPGYGAVVAKETEAANPPDLAAVCGDSEQQPAAGFLGRQVRAAEHRSRRRDLGSRSAFAASILPGGLTVADIEKAAAVAPRPGHRLSRRGRRQPAVGRTRPVCPASPCD
jgi:hypothetical protein